MHLSGYRCMWIMVMFDLPVKTKMERKRYTKFRTDLLKDGFMLTQFSVYLRHCPSIENAEVHAQRIKNVLPSSGEVRILFFTDKQFERMQVFTGKREKCAEKAPEQLLFF